MAQELIEQRLAGQETKIPGPFLHVQRGAVGPQQRADVLEILRAVRIVHQSLQLESNQPLRAHDAQFAKSGFQLHGSGQEAPCDRAAGVEKIDALVAADVVRRIGAAVQAAVAQPNELTLA